MSGLSLVIRTVAGGFFPRECTACGMRGGWLCASCRTHLPLVAPYCPVCRAVTLDGRTHPACRREFALDGCIAAAGLSVPPIRQLVYGCKYHGLASAADALADLMARAVAASPSLTAWIAHMHPTLCPIPLHPQQERTRGFNQAALIADALHRRLSFSCTPLLSRIKATADQTKLTRAQRRHNLAQAFSVPLDAPALPSAVLLIDDVVTTGATFDAAAHALRNAKKEIEIWGLAAAYHAAQDPTPGLAHSTLFMAV